MNQPKKLLFLFLFFCQALVAQDYLGGDLAFFQKKLELYQHWMEAKGMSTILKADKIELAKNGMELELFLSLRTTDPDIAAAYWGNLQDAFPVQNPGQTIEEVLFQTFARMMEIPPGQGNIQIYFPKKDGSGYNPCLYVWIWEENGNVVQESRINNCKAQSLTISVKTPDIGSVQTRSESRIANKEDARTVFNKILNYARQRYEITISDRNPRIEEDQMTDYTLKFVATDLSKEVLTDERKSLWCRTVEYWGGICNDTRRERLEFTFNFIPTAEGYTLSGTLTGKFGSGVYEPRRSGYMDMEPDFEQDFLEPYVIKFQNELTSYLEGR